MRTWLITGVSSGFGRALAEFCIDRGDRVVGTLRNEAQRAEFEALMPGRSFGVLLDVTQDANVLRVVKKSSRASAPSMCSSTMPATASRARSKRRR